MDTSDTDRRIVDDVAHGASSFTIFIYFSIY